MHREMKIPLVKMWTECEKPASSPRNSLAKEKRTQKASRRGEKGCKTRFVESRRRNGEESRVEQLARRNERAKETRKVVIWDALEHRQHANGLHDAESGAKALRPMTHRSGFFLRTRSHVDKRRASDGVYEKIGKQKYY